MHKLLLIALAGLIAGTAVWLVLPTAPDDRQVEQMLRDRAWDLFGRRLTVRGEIDTRLFPSPAVVATGLVLEAPEGRGATPVAAIDRLEADLDGWGLDGTPPAIDDLVLTGVRLVLEVQADGRANWIDVQPSPPPPVSMGPVGGLADHLAAAPTVRLMPSRTGIGGALPGGGTGTGAADAAGGPARVNRRSVVALPAVPRPIADLAGLLPAAVTIDAATVHYRNLARGTMLRLDDVTLDAERAPSGGAYRVDLAAVWDAMPVAINGIVGIPRRDSDGALTTRLELAASSTLLPAAARFEGTAAHGRATPLAGRLTVEADDFGSLLAALPADARTVAAGPLRLPGALGRPFRFDTALAYGDEVLDMQHLTAELGAVTVTGKGQVGFPTVQFGRDLSVDGSLTVRRLDIDQLARHPARLYQWRDARQPGRQGRAGTDLAPTGRAAAPLPTAPPFPQVAFPRVPAAGVPAAGVPAALVPAAALDPAGRMVIPGMVTGRIDVVIDSAIVNGEAIRDLRLDLGLRDGLVGVDQATALLPGGTDITLFGQVARAPNSLLPSFSGNLQGGSTGLRHTLEWLGVTLSVPTGRLMQAEFTAGVDASFSGVELVGLDLRIDDTQALGRVAWLRGARTGLDVGLAFDRLNLDPYLDGPAYRSPATAAGTDRRTISARQQAATSMAARLVRRQQSGEAGVDIPPPGTPGMMGDGHDGVPGLSIERPFASTPGLLSLRDLESIDLRLDLRAGSVVWRGEASQSVRLAGVLRQGALRLSEARVTGYAGSTLTVTGALTNLLGRPRFDGRFNLAAPEAAPILQAANWPVRQALGPLVLDGTASGALEELEVVTRLDVGGLSGSLSGLLIDLQAASPRYDMQLDLRHPDMGRFVTGFGLTAGPGSDRMGSDRMEPDRMEPKRMGPLRLVGRAAGSASGGALDVQAGLFGGDLSLVGQINLADGFTYGGRLRFRHADTNRMIDFVDPQRDRAAARAGPLDLAANLVGDLTGFELLDLNATVGSVPVTGQVALAFARPKPLLLADLQTGDLDTALLLPHPWVETGGPLRTSWEPDLPVDFAGLRGVDSRVQLRADAITHRGYRLADAELNAVLQEEVLTVETLTGRLMGGPVQISGTVRPASAQVDLVAVGTDTRAAARLGRDLGYPLGGGTLAFDLKLGARGLTLGDLVASLSGSILFEIADTELFGLDQERLSDGLRRVTSQEQLAALVRRSLGGAGRARSRIESIAGALAVDQGVLTTDQLVFIADYLQGRIDGSIDLAALRQDLTVLMQLTRNEEAPFLSMALAGQTAAPRRTYDIDLLSRSLFGESAAPVTDPAGAATAPDAPPAKPAPPGPPAKPTPPGPPVAGLRLPGLIPPGSTTPLSADDPPVTDPDLPAGAVRSDRMPSPALASTGDPVPLPETSNLEFGGDATAGPGRRPLAVIDLPVSARPPEPPPPVPTAPDDGDGRQRIATAGGIDLSRVRSGDPIMRQLMRRSRSDGSRARPDTTRPDLTLATPDAAGRSIGPARAAAPSTEAISVPDDGGPLPLPGTAGTATQSRPEAAAAARRRNAPLFTIEGFDETPESDAVMVSPGSGSGSGAVSGGSPAAVVPDSGADLPAVAPRTVPVLIDPGPPSAAVTVPGREPGVPGGGLGAPGASLSAPGAAPVPRAPEPGTGPAASDDDGYPAPRPTPRPTAAVPPPPGLPVIPPPKPPVPEAIRLAIERARAAESRRMAAPASRGGAVPGGFAVPGGRLAAPGMTVVTTPRAPKSKGGSPDTVAAPAAARGVPQFTAPGAGTVSPAPERRPQPPAAARTPGTTGQGTTGQGIAGQGGSAATPAAGAIPVPGARATAVPPPGADNGAAAGIATPPLSAPGGGIDLVAPVVEFGAEATNRGPAPLAPAGAAAGYFEDPGDAALADVPTDPIKLPTMPWQRRGGGAPVAASPLATPGNASRSDLSPLTPLPPPDFGGDGEPAVLQGAGPGAGSAPAGTAAPASGGGAPPSGLRSPGGTLGAPGAGL